MIALLAATVVFSSFLLGKVRKDGDADKRKGEVLIEVIMESLKRRHFLEPKVNDEFSSNVYALYLKRLDFGKRFLLASDVRKLSTYRTRLDDQITARKYDFFDQSVDIMEKRLKEADTYYQAYLGKPFDFTIDEAIETDPDKLEFAADQDALKERWRKLLKSQVLARLVNKLEAQEKAREEGATAEDKPIVDKSFEQLEEESRKAVRKTYDNLFRRLGQLDREDRMAIYINAIVNVYGPHTGYFPPKDKENFDISMSGRLEGIGARLQERDGFIKVASIVPGSASHRRGELKEGDIILKVAQGDDEPVDVVDMPLDDAVKLIRGKKGTEVRLTVKKIDGNTTIIPIERDVVIIEETYAKSAVLESENTKQKIGYIKLPKFYADFARKGGPESADDVEKEIAKLKKEGVDGMILDLRNNGGGSLQEAVKMAGLFIPKGPVVQVKGRGPEARVFKDYDSSVSYDGPLVVMVNRFSASASEILAAAMQDYDRAVIMGSETSFGKGTVQNFFALDRLLPAQFQSVKPLGELKLTTQKFYRID
ncbi:MAG: S41 family peptidase, partial [Bacteroidota bacterium]